MTKVEFNPVSFRADLITNEVKKRSQTDTPKYTENELAAIENLYSQNSTANAQKPHKSFSLRNGIAKVWKFFTVFGQMTNSAIKGVVGAIVVSAGTMGLSWVFNALPKAFTKEGPTLWQTIRHPLKQIGKSGKIMAAITGSVTLISSLIMGKLAANQKTAVIDHKLKTGHRNI